MKLKKEAEVWPVPSKLHRFDWFLLAYLVIVIGGTVAGFLRTLS
jgi:hypothetical protein